MSEPVYFLRLEMENVRCFGEKATLDLSDGNGNWKKWTVILGDNGTGKTTILQCIAGLENDDTNNKYLEIDKERYAGPTMLNYVVKYHTDIRKRSYHLLGASVGAYTSPKNDNLPFQQTDIYYTHEAGGLFRTKPHDSYSLSPFYCYGYGANRLLSKNSLSENRPQNSETLFDDDSRLINAEEWLLQLDYAASKESEIKEFATKKRGQVKQTLKDILPDIEDVRFTPLTKGNINPTVEFKTPYGWVTIHQLSLGYKTMVAWMVDLAARLFERYPDSDNPLAEPAIVLVDEIDLHMHPKWQRKIFDYLSEKFPKTQFIVTAHSPLIVQSAPKDANIVVLRREGDHVVIDNDTKSVQNWRLDQIMMSDLFGVESARGPEAEKWLEERKKLLQKEGVLTDAERQRLKALNEQAESLPTADAREDIEAMEIIRKAALYLKGQPA